MACNAASMKLGEGWGKGAVEPEGLLVLAHLSVFLIQLITTFIRVVLTSSGNDEWAAGEAEQGILYIVIG